MILLLLLVPVLAIGILSFVRGRQRITVGELAIQLAVAGGLVVGGYYVARWAALLDHEIWNGRIASKSSGYEPCCHSYECNCHQSCTGSGSDRSCTRHCSTCYRHSQDRYWQATSTNDEVVYRDGCNAPGTPEPASWSAIREGEPTAWEHSFTNYVRAAPGDFFRGDVERFAGRLPEYPRTHGWQANRFLFVGREAPEAAPLSAALAELNAELGAAKQVNLVVVVAAEQDPAYFGALATHWLGGKKNDVVLVIGAPDFPAIAWARVMAWNQEQGAEDLFKDSLARRIEKLATFDAGAVLAALQEEVSEKYVRRSFSELESLLERATPPAWALVLLFVLGSGLSLLLQWAFWKNGWRRGAPPPPPLSKSPRPLP